MASRIERAVGLQFQRLRTQQELAKRGRLSVEELEYSRALTYSAVSRLREVQRGKRTGRGYSKRPK
jgi:hypothetical protein